MPNIIKVGGGGKKPVYLGEISATRTSTTEVKFSIASAYADYKNITMDNLIVMFTGISKTTYTYDITLSYAYDSSAGQIIVTASDTLFNKFSTQAKIYVVFL
ncbi:MAG: hypothetical protein ACOX4U_00415 [Anaerovoracaceae bacterium]|jgi:hypothetical protein